MMLKSRQRAERTARQLGHVVIVVADGYEVQPRADDPEEVAANSPLDEAAHEAATSPNNDLPEPTEAQKEASNYKMGHLRIGGLDISIENPQGSTRSGTDRDGKAWETTLAHHYGYVRGSVGADKDHVDVFVKPGTPEDHAGTVYVIDQIHPDTGHFDEHKCCIGFSDEGDAAAGYRANYAEGWKGLKSIAPMEWDQFKTWVLDQSRTKEQAALAPVVVEEVEAAPGPADDSTQPIADSLDTSRAAVLALRAALVRSIAQRWLAAVKAKEPGKIAAVKAAMADWNKAHPDMHIGMNSGLIRQIVSRETPDAAGSREATGEPHGQEFSAPEGAAIQVGSAEVEHATAEAGAPEADANDAQARARRRRAAASARSERAIHAAEAEPVPVDGQAQVGRRRRQPQVAGPTRAQRRATTADKPKVKPSPATIELRKRVAVLESLKACLS